MLFNAVGHPAVHVNAVVGVGGHGFVAYGDFAVALEDGVGFDGRMVVHGDGAAGLEYHEALAEMLAVDGTVLAVHDAGAAGVKLHAFNIENVEFLHDIPPWNP